MSEGPNKDTVATFGAFCLLAAPVCMVAAGAFLAGWGGAFAAGAFCCIAGVVVAIRCS